MKRIDMNICFKDYTASVFCETIQLIVARSGHYADLLTVPCRIIHNRNCNKVNVTLSYQSNNDKVKMARKHHRQFAHVPSDKLLKLVSSTGQLWSSDSELKEKIKSISKNCSVCMISKLPPRPVVGYPFASKFKGCVRYIFASKSKREPLSN